MGGRLKGPAVAPPTPAAIDPDDAPAFERALADVTRAPVRLRCRVRHADGSWRQVESVGRDLRHEPAVGGIVFNTRDVTERAELEAALVRQAYHDAITGLANRAYFDERLAEAFAGRARTGAEVAAVLLDVDHFKRLNDTYGHPFGDEVLRAVGLADAADVLPERLSGGMRKRVGLARALAARPSVLLADDPLAGLDPGTARQVARVLEDVAGTGSLIIAAPDVPPELGLGRWVYLREGRMVHDGPPAPGV